MNLETIHYTHYELGLPQSGQHILGQLRGDNIIVYQAFNPAIANYAVKHQKFGGSAYSFTRMSWIKPNFLWMMYRAGLPIPSKGVLRHSLKMRRARTTNFLLTSNKSCKSSKASGRSCMSLIILGGFRGFTKILCSF